MAINFNEDSTFNLVPTSISSVADLVDGLLVPGEEIVMAFKTIRDRMIFTNLRVIGVDVQGITGRKKTFSILPYHRIQYFTLTTPGFAELFSDVELTLAFSNSFTAKFEISGSVDIGLLGRTISQYVLPVLPDSIMYK